MGGDEINRELSGIRERLGAIEALMSAASEVDKRDDRRTEAALTQHDKRIGVLETSQATIRARVGFLIAGASVGSAGLATLASKLLGG